MILWGEPQLSSFIAGAYLLLLTVLWSAVVFGVGRWGARWFVSIPGRDETSGREDGRTVSICIPARDEEAVIARCVEAALSVQ